MSVQHMRFIHCADLHLDSRMESHLTPFQAQNRRKELLQNFFRMADYAELHDIRAILISGDLFDTAHPASSTVKAVLNCIQEHHQIDFLYLSGNHDNQILSQTSLDINCPDNLWLLQSTGINFYDSPNSFLRHTVIQKDYGPITITGLTGAPSQLPELSSSRINLVMLHGQIYQQAVSFESGMNHSFNYSLKDFSERNIDYIAAGHVHQYQFGPIDRRGYYCYSGCLEGRGFDECGEKGFVLLDIAINDTSDIDSIANTDSINGIDSIANTNNNTNIVKNIIINQMKEMQISFQLIPFAVRYLYDLNIDLTDCTNYQEAWQQIDQLFSTIDNPHLVRLKLTGRILPELNLHIDWLIQKYIDDFYLLCIDDCTKPAISYDDYRYDISLKGEFIRLVLSDSGLTDEEKEKVIMEGLHVLAGEEVRLG